MRRAPTRGSLARVALVLIAAAPASARVISFPMHLDHAFVRQLVLEEIFNGPEESVRIWQERNPCTEVVLSHPKLSERDGRLHLVASFHAKLGAGTGQWCFNATERSGTFDAAMEPHLHASLPVVEFRVVGSDLYDGEGVKRFSGALWDWVRSHVHPRLETLRIDLYQPIHELKTFLPALFPHGDFDGVQRLLDSVSLVEVGVGTDAITVGVRLDAPEPARPTPAPPPPEPPLTADELARWDSAWQSWDGFLTFLIKHSSKDAGDSLQSELREVFLEARHDIVRILGATESRPSDPVRPLFLKTWKRLAPIMRQLTTSLPGEAALRYVSFITAADALAALEQLEADYGVEVSTDGLRRMARMIEPVPFGDPVAYSQAVDPELRTLFGFGPPPPLPENAETPEAEPGLPSTPTPAPELPQPEGSQRKEPLPHSYRTRTGLEILFVAGGAKRALDQWIPKGGEVLEYLPLVRDLLVATARKTQREKVLAAQYATLYRNLVLATAWQESCWRQFIRKAGALQPLTSSVGDVGIMQVNQRVWRGFYDQQALRKSMKYNAQAGGEILRHYLVDYAIKKGEHKVRNNPDDLARATYAAYNGGPSKLRRYRWKAGAKVGHRIDDSFWKKYQQVKAGNDLAVRSCFPGLGA